MDVDAAFENRSQRANTEEESFDVANVVFARGLSLGDVSLRQELGWTLGAHVVEAGGEVHRLGTGLSFEIRGDRNPAAANGSSTSDRPRIVEQRDQSIPRVPTIGFRFRF